MSIHLLQEYTLPDFQCLHIEAVPQQARAEPGPGKPSVCIDGFALVQGIARY